MKPEDTERGVAFRQQNAPQLKQGDSYLLAIGINSYQHFPPLHNAVKDVQDFADLMARDYGFRNEAPYVQLLLDEQATRDNIIQALSRLCRHVKEDDRVLLYYSGHGFLDSYTHRGYWIPVEAEPEREAGYISNADVRDYIKAMKSRHTLLISDSCFSGALLVRGAMRDVSGAFEDWENKRSRWLFCSGRGVVSDGTPGRNSPFSAQILRVLRDRRLDKVNIARLADEVITSVRFNYEQQAEACPLFGADHDGGQFVFYRPLTEAQKEEIAFQAAMAGRNKAVLILFLDSAANPEHKRAARQLLREIEETETWQAVNKTSFAALDEFLENHPKSPYSGEARALMDQFRGKLREAEEKRIREAEAQRAREAEEKRAREVEAEKAREAEEQRIREAEAQKAREAEEKRIREAEAQKAREAEEKRIREAEARKAREAEEQRAREAEAKKAREAEEQRIRQVEAQKAREAEEKRVREAEARRAREAEEQRAREAQLKAHDEAWQRALTQHTIDGYRQFLAEYPASPNVREARRLLKELGREDRPLLPALPWQRYAVLAGGALTLALVLWLLSGLFQGGDTATGPDTTASKDSTTNQPTAAVEPNPPSSSKSSSTSETSRANPTDSPTEKPAPPPTKFTSDYPFDAWYKTQESFYLTQVRDKIDDPNEGKVLDFEVQQRAQEFSANLKSAVESTNAADKTLTLQHIQFESGSATLRPDSKYELDNLVTGLNVFPQIRIEIAGHTDNTGNPADNYALSQQRAATVAKYLTDRGIDAGRLRTTGYGDSMPLAPNDTEENRAKNRRTEFTIL